MNRAQKLGYFLAVAAATTLLFIACGDGAGGPEPTPTPIPPIPTPTPTPTPTPVTIPPAPGVLPAAPNGILVDLLEYFSFAASGVHADGETGNAWVVRAGDDYFSWSGIPSGPSHDGLPNAHNAVEGLLDAIALGAFDASSFTGIRFHHRSSHPWVLTITDVDDGDFSLIYPSWSPPPASNEWRLITIHFASLVHGWGSHRDLDFSNIYQLGFQVNSVPDEEGGITWVDGVPVMGFEPAWMEVANFRFIDDPPPEPDVIFSMAALVYEKGITAGTPLTDIDRLSSHEATAAAPTWVENPNGGLSLRVRGGHSMHISQVSGVRIDFADLQEGDIIVADVRGAPDFFLTPASEAILLLNQQNLPPAPWWNILAANWGETSGTLRATLNVNTVNLAYASIMANQGTGYFYVDSITILRLPDLTD